MNRRRKDLAPEQAARVVAMVQSLLDQKRYASNADIGRALGLRGQAISQWFSGKNSPSYAAAEQVAKLADVSVQDLLGPPLPSLSPASNDGRRK